MMRSGLVFASLLVLGCGGGSSDPDAAPDAPIATFDTAQVPDALPACAVPTGAGTTHAAYVTTDETWTFADSPHIVTFDIAIQQATLTIERCATVQIGDGYTISIGLGGTAGDPPSVLVADSAIFSEVAGSGTHWGSLRVFPTGLLDLTDTTLVNGGEITTTLNGATIIAFGARGPALTRNVRVRDIDIQSSGGVGVSLQGGAAFTEDSTGLGIQGSGQQADATVQTQAPIMVAAPAVQSIPPGTRSGNALQEILVVTDAIAVDETFHAYGLPYRLLGTFSMSPAATLADGGLATLTIEAGVTIKNLRTRGGDASINLGTSNDVAPTGIWAVRVIAAGAAAAPITFTSAEPAPAAGDWAGIKWGGGPPTGNVMSNVHVEYAGGESGTEGYGCGPVDNDAALIIRNWKPDDAFITASTFSTSATGGIVSGWFTDAGGPDLSTGNTFTSIGNACNVARWKNITAPACPSLGVTPDCL